MRRSRPTAALFAVLMVLAMALAACAGGGESEPADASAPAGGESSDGGGGGETVSLAGAQFTPSELTIAAGSTVTFTDTSNHTVTEGSDGTAVDDPIVDESGGSDIEVTFDEPGTYNITCTIHPTMNMTITVEG
jgi:plastocyanin